MMKLLIYNTPDTWRMHLAVAIEHKKRYLYLLGGWKGKAGHKAAGRHEFYASKVSSDAAGRPLRRNDRFLWRLGRDR